MGRHHTKDKGDLGVAKAHADLAGHGYTVLFPATEHAPFDLVTYRDHEFLRVQVKYRSVYRGGIRVAFASSWADRHGTHSTPTDKSAVDLLCVYCPDTDACYYLRPRDVGRSVTLRVHPSRNHQQEGVLDASCYRLPP